MPYIEKYSRKLLDANLNTLSKKIDTMGKLNYSITKLCLQVLKRTQMSYTTLNEIPGVLDCVKAEFYRRVIVPYEEQKMKENGDIY